MKKYTKLNLALLTVIAVIAAFLLLNDTERAEQAPVTVSKIDRRRITVITINSDQRKDIIFDKKSGAWQMVSPLHARANSTRIAAILSLLQARSYTQLNAGGMDLGKFDLVKPAVTLKLNHYEFLFGNSNPLEGRRYLLFQGVIHLIDDGLYQQLQQPADFFIQDREN